MQVQGDRLQATYRAELDFVASKLARSPRLATLLRYIGSKTLDGDGSCLREYTIATEVFARPEKFDPSEDAIARVEAHRLRKKLKEFYETDGRDRPVRIVLPPGSYVPVFETAIEPKASTEVAPAPAAGSDKGAGNPASRKWTYAVAALLIGLSAFAIYNLGLRKPPHASVLPQFPAQPAVPVAVPAIHILAGYFGQPRIDNRGVTWGADQYVQGGQPVQGPQTFIARTTQQMLFQSAREGDFSYDIPLKPGVYELHLYFVEMTFGTGLGGFEGGGELSRTFHILMNGKQLLPGFDIESDAMGGDVADEKVFRDVEPAQDGRLHLDFQSDAERPLLSAIAILPGLPRRQFPIRIVAQRTPYIDRLGQRWSPDNYFSNGVLNTERHPVSGTPEPGLFAAERIGHFSYSIPVDLRDAYTVTLHFAEFYWGPKASGWGGAGSRRFNVYCNGVFLLRDFDILREASSYTAVTKTFPNIRPSPQGKLNLTFEPIANYATVSAIEVEDQNQ